MRKRILEIAILTITGLILILTIELFVKDNNAKLELSEVVPTMEYGIVVDSLVIYRDRIKRNEFLAEILLRYNVDYATIDLAAKRAKPIFDVRRIRTGHKYSVLCTNDSLKKVQYFVYENSPTSYIVFDLKDSVHIHTGNKEIEIRMNEIGGEINSSLWNSIIDNEGDPNLANELSEIFAWTIDFFGIRKGDNYKVIYEELYVEDEKIGLGKIQTAVFNHINKNHYAFYFIQDSIGDYFDEKGGSLRRAFLKAPLRFKRISSRYSNSRLHPVLKIRRPHRGVDYAAAAGTPVHSVGDGVVSEIKRTRQGGNQIKIKHNGTYTTAYLHLSKYASGMKAGKKVKQGETIAYVGATGLATGPHLDFRFYRNGKAIDPLKVESPPVNPVDPSCRTTFDSIANQYKGLLDSICYSEI
ncbi:MAG: peptidoglycan DD-metalloendopeptidase family protein [Bacteroidetes bacterium]|nr:peptidoglycan DD-metalloendopeptidase family protein [Bacteroidota bacterium]